MAQQAAWEKPRNSNVTPPITNPERLKFLIGGILILVAVGYLIISNTISGTQFYMTVDELLTNPEYVGKTVRVAGVVDGDTIRYDQQNLVLDFIVANVPMEYDNLADALHNAVSNPDAQRIPVHVENEVKPDLLRHEAQAIMTGSLGEDGIFYVTELNLKCPTRFEAAQPEI